MSWIKGVITEGQYKGKPIEVKFGKPLKILCDGRDITGKLIALRIDLDVHGQVVYLKLAEENYSQVPSETWEKMAKIE